MSARKFRRAVEWKALPILFSAVLAVSSVHAQQNSELEDIEFTIPANLQSEEFNARRAVLDNNVFPQVRQGDRFLKERQYSSAWEAYRRALKMLETDKLGKSEFVASLRNQINARMVKARKGWGQSIFDQARKIYLDALVEKDSAKAIEGFRQAQSKALSAVVPYYGGGVQLNQEQRDEQIRRDRGFYDNVQAFMTDCTKMEEAYNFRAETRLETIDPDFKRRQSEIDFLLKQGEVYYRSQQYEKVRSVVEKVLLQDPYNQKAVTLLKKVYKKLYRIGLARAEVSAMEQMAEVEWKWNEPIPPDDIQNDIPVIEKTDSSADTYTRLQKTLVDKIEYEDAEIQSIIDNLKSQYKDFNFVYPERMEDRTRVIKYLELEKTNLMDVIRYICDIANLKYKIEKDAIRIGVKKADDMETRYFPVRKSLIDRIAIEAEGGEGDKQNDTSKDSLKDAERFADKSLLETKDKEVKKTVAVTPEMLKKYFSEMGILFEEGSEINYDSHSSRLGITNTPTELKKLASLLKEIDIPAPLVLVDAKIMEVSMNTLEELGFDWMLTYTDKDTNRRYSFGGLSSSTFYRSSSSNLLVDGLKIIPNFGGSNQFNLSLSIHALDQKDRSEILATPRLLVASGYQGKLLVSEERFFPDDYDDTDVEIENNSVSIKPGKANFSDGTNVGTTFSVKPTVSANGHSILLDINTEISRMTGWSSYDYNIIIGNSVASQIPVKKPELSKRILKSQVKIYDGETVVIGGVLEDIASRREDKWPLLGEIPLLGRLFTDISVSTEKVNLLVFVTARLMQGNGLPVKNVRKQGLFEFNDR